jgi:anti-sigma regulatory factor (Ser/Thr protein kinase)
MYGFSRLMGRVAKKTKGEDVCGALVSDLEGWTGQEAEQEDDITLVVIRKTASASRAATVFDSDEEILIEFSLPSLEGNERVAIDKVSEVVSSVGLTPARFEKLKTAVGETVMNAIEHGNENDPELEVAVAVSTTPTHLRVRVTDQGGDKVIPEAATPDIEAKLAGEQSPRGWGLFLVGQMVDEVNTARENGHHIVELVMNREGES